jgi:hypothetical protein
MATIPPAANVPPIFKEPLASAPVLSEKVPRSPVTVPPPLRPTTAINVDPERVSPAVVPESVPPPLLKSTVLLADARFVSAKHERKQERRVAKVADFIEELLADDYRDSGWLCR